MGRDLAECPRDAHCTGKLAHHAGSAVIIIIRILLALILVINVHL